MPVSYDQVGGDAQRGHTAAQQCCVAPAVAPEGVTTLVVAVAVDLDDQPSVHKEVDEPHAAERYLLREPDAEFSEGLREVGFCARPVETPEDWSTEPVGHGRIEQLLSRCEAELARLHRRLEGCEHVDARSALRELFER